MISIPECTDFDANFGCEPTIDCCWGKLYVTRSEGFRAIDPARPIE
ncbi:hypothetical protein QUA56_16940 [Microcoleus sp. N3A4]